MSELLNFILDHEEAFKSNRRLASLYSDFSYLHATNPDGYQANINAWRNALINASRAGLLPGQGAAKSFLTIQTGPELLGALRTREWGQPLALGSVIQDALTKKELIPLKDFISSRTSIYHRSWAISPWQIISWSLRQLGVLGEYTSNENLGTGNFVAVANVQMAAESVLREMSNSYEASTDLIYTPSTFLSSFSHIINADRPLTPTDLSILLTYLSRDKQALTHNTTTIKFAPPHAAPMPITEQDTTVANLRELITSHQNQISQLTKRVTDLDSTARAAVKARATISARSALRSKKLAETILQRRVDTLAQLEEVFTKIQTAADNVEIIRVLQASSGVLRNLNAQVGGAEGVEGVVNVLRDEMDKVNEVASMLAEPGAEGIDEMEVDEEFEALEKAEREKEAKEEAERTRKRLEELEKAEAAAREKAEASKARREEKGDAVVAVELPKEKATEQEVEESIREMSRISLDETRPTATELHLGKKEPLPAT